MSPSPLALLFALILPAVTLVHGGPRFIIFPDTTSPDGGYAFAWGLPAEYKIDWDAVHRTGETTALLDVAAGNPEVENYLVELKAERVLMKLEDSMAWRLPDGRSSPRQFLQVCWAPASDLAIVGTSDRWGSGPVEVFQFSAGKVMPAVEIGGELDAAFRAYLARPEGKVYSRRASKLVTSFDGYRATGGGKFSVSAFAEVPRSIEDDGVFAEHRIRFSLSSSPPKPLAVKILEVAPISAADPELAQRLEKGDRLLNTTYQELVSKLDGPGVNELRREQREWLKERDAIKNPKDRAFFIENRVETFRERLSALKR
jgi:hypothetical protein